MENNVKIWDIESDNLLAKFMGSTTPIKGIAIAPDEKTFLISSFDNTVTQWYVVSLIFISKINIGN